jgi:predicted deacetylase
LQAIRRGQERMVQFGNQRMQVFVPPWGRVSPQVVAHLAGLGFQGLSASYLRKAPREQGLAIANTHALVPRRTRTGWTFQLEATVSQLVTVLSSLRRKGKVHILEPVGINTHHQRVGPLELGALDSLVRVTRAHGASWLTPHDVFSPA